MFNFATPLAFFLLIPWAVAAWRLYRRGKAAGVLFAPASRLPWRTAGWRVAVARMLPALFLFGALLLIFAAARPRTTLARERRSVNAIAIGMVIDVSGSMSALDFAPSGKFEPTRLDVIKETFAQFVAARPDDLIGLVTFATYASTRAPLTVDHRMLRHVLGGVEIPKEPGEDRTAIGDGLSTALARLADAEPKTRIVVLLTDGENNDGIISPDQAAAAAAKLGVRVYVIGVGTHGRVPAKGRDMFGREGIGYMDVAFNEPQLKAIAEKTNGRYFNVRDEKALKSALEEISTLETTKIERQVYERYNEHFVNYLLLGAALVALALTLNMGVAKRLL
ncbi:MAG: VWA domain-containing protein [Kiritimatiellaeota bacterium]|nr:VWA domain-containing protein [Kiritimatiellota bacterium]